MGMQIRFGGEERKGLLITGIIPWQRIPNYGVIKVHQQNLGRVWLSWP
jgi:hypothetical protein